MKLTHSSHWSVVLLVALLALTGASGGLNAQEASSERLLVLLRDASALAIVDPTNGTVLGRVPTGRDPHEVTATPDGRLAFVASPSDWISVLISRPNGKFGG